VLSIISSPLEFQLHSQIVPFEKIGVLSKARHIYMAISSPWATLHNTFLGVHLKVTLILKGKNKQV
jgi:hypothetical protein